MNIINQIRLKLNMTQEEFGEVLGGVTPLTINRWEKEKVVPSTIAQNNIYNLIKSNNIDLFELIVEYYSNINSIHDLILYHGSKKGIIGDIMPISKIGCDFGTGFYMGTAPEQPLMLVSNNPNPVYYLLTINLNNLKVKEIKDDLDWAMVIAYNRGYMEKYKDTAIYNKYAHYLDGIDVVIGKIADDRLYKVMTRFFENEITVDVLLHSLQVLDLGYQYVLKTTKACKRVTILEEQHLLEYEYRIINDKSIEKREHGIKITEEMFVKYRRSGKYFDEIIEEVKDHD